MTISPGLAVPPDFILLTKPSPFLTILGPVYAKGMSTSMVMGFHVQRRHLNRRGILRGDVVVSLADAALGYCLAKPSEGTGDTLAISTAGLMVNFIASTEEGDWIEITPGGLYMSSKLAFAQALLYRGDRLITCASTVFAVLGRHV